MVGRGRYQHTSVSSMTGRHKMARKAMSESRFRLWLSRGLAVSGVGLIFWLGLHLSGDQQAAREAAAARDQQLLRAELIIISAPVALVMCDDQGTITVCNPGSERLLGWNHSELIGQNVEVIIPTHLRKDHKRQMVIALKAALKREDNWIRRTVGLKTQALHKDGSEVDVIVSIRVIKYGDNVEFIASIRPQNEATRVDSFPLPEFSEPAQRALDD